MAALLKKLTPFYLYLLSALIYGGVLSFCALTIMTQSTQAEVIFFFSSSFFAAFLIAFDGKGTLKLFCLSLILSFFSTMSFVWPIGANSLSFPSQCLTFVALFSAIILLNVYHREKSLIPAYPVFFNDVWQKIALLLLLLLFCLGMALILFLFVTIFELLGIAFIEHLFDNKVVVSFIASFTLIMGLFICQQSARLLALFKEILIRFSVIFFILLSLIAWLFVLICFLRVLTDGDILVSKGTYVYTLFWFGFFSLIFFNGTFPYYLSIENKQTRLMRLLKFLLVSYPFIGLILTSLMYGAFYIYTYDLVTSSHGMEYFWVSENNFIEYIAFSLLWLYFAFYSFGKLITNDDFFSNLLPKVNLLLAGILIISTWGLINPISSFILSLEKVEGLPYIPQQASLKKPETALSGTKLKWTSNQEESKPLVLGSRNGKNLYACQAHIAKSIVGGESPDKNSCRVNFEGREFLFKHFKLLEGHSPILWTASNYTKEYRLVRSTFLQDPVRAFALCRTIYQNKIYLGHSKPGYWRCQIIVNDEPVSAQGLQLLYVKTKDATLP
jgi:hypothetical protein